MIKMPGLRERFARIRDNSPARIAQVTGLLLDASAFPYVHTLQELVERCFWTVQACEPCTSVRTQYVSLHRWAALCATVEGATVQQLKRLVDLVEYELANPDGPDSSGVQNWYLTKSIGKMTPLRRQICAAVPKRSPRVGLNGARTRNQKRLAASTYEPGPGSSPPGGACIPFPQGGRRS